MTQKPYLAHCGLNVTSLLIYSLCSQSMSNIVCSHKTSVIHADSDNMKQLLMLTDVQQKALCIRLMSVILSVHLSVPYFPNVYAAARVIWHVIKVCHQRMGAASILCCHPRAKNWHRPMTDNGGVFQSSRPPTASFSLPVKITEVISTVTSWTKITVVKKCW